MNNKIYPPKTGKSTHTIVCPLKLELLQRRHREHLFKKHEITRSLTEERGTFAGYASVFNRVDFQGDLVLPGAFQVSLSHHHSHNTVPDMLWQHQKNKVIGQWLHMVEDERGLWVVGQLNLKDPLGAYAYRMIREKKIDSLSIGYLPLHTRKDPLRKRCLLQQIHLWEVSLVTQGANPCARIRKIKSMLFPRPQCKAD